MGYAIGTTDPSIYGVSNHIIALGLDIQHMVTQTTTPASATEGIPIDPTQVWTLKQRSGVLITSVSSEIAGSGAFLVKDDVSTHTQPWQVDTSNALPYTAAYKLGASTKPTKMYLMSQGARAPKDFSLEYSNDGVTWTTHQSWTNQVISTSMPGTLYTLNPLGASYPWWRLKITAITTGAFTTMNLNLFSLYTEDNFHHTTHPIWAYQLPGLSNTAPDRSFAFIRGHILHGSFNNLLFSTSTGFIANTLPQDQPGSYKLQKQLALASGAMPYWIAFNGQKLIPHLKCSTSIRGGYIGKFFPFATPLQYPLPFYCGMPLNGQGDISYTDPSNDTPFKGINGNMSILGPYNATEILGNQLRMWPFDQRSDTSNTRLPATINPAVPVDKPSVSGASVSASNTYTFSASISSYRIVPGMNIRVSGFANAANNGAKLVTAVTSTTVVVSDTALVIETAPGAISIKVIDFALFPVTIYSAGTTVQTDMYGNLDGVYRVAANASISSEDLIYVGSVKHIVFNFGTNIEEFFAIRLG